MSKDVSLSKSFLNGFGILNLGNDPNMSSLNNDTGDTQEQNRTHDLTCRTTKTEGDTDNSDDTETNSDAILVVDSSCTSSDVSYMWISSSSATSQSKSYVSNTDTIPETDSDITIDDSIKCDFIMDNRESTPLKRKHNGNPANQKNQSTSLEECPQPITTRSGRSVRKRYDIKFDYTSELHNSDSDDEDDPNFEDQDDDSDNGDHDYNLPGCTDVSRNNSSISMRSSWCSSSSSSVMLDTDALIYLDLKESTAVVSIEPTADAAVEHDIELKTRMQKFLGLIAPLRRLYNPMSNFNIEDNMDLDEDEPTPVQRRRNADKAFNMSTPQKSEPERSLTFCTTPLRPDMDNNTKMLLFDHMVLRANAAHFESQTPQHIKEPIDLSGLPTTGLREQICRRHKQTSNMIGPYTGVYGFVDSLKLFFLVSRNF